MKVKIFSTIFILIALGITLTPFYCAQAGNVSDITFQNKPLFNDIDIMPGDSFIRWVKVASKSENSLSVKTTAVNISDPDRLGDMLDMTIRKGSTILYQNTLSAFFNAGSLSLGTLTAYENAQYDFSVAFNKSADNNYQNKSLVFDITFTAEDAEAGGDEPEYRITSSSSGGSGILLSSSPHGYAETGDKGEEKTVVLGEEAAPKLRITKTVESDTFNPGQTGITYTITVYNEGNLPAYDVILEDTLPEGLTFNGTDKIFDSWNIGTIEANSSKQIIYKVDISKNIQPGRYANKATVRSSNNDSVSATADIQVKKPSVLGLELALTGFNILEFAALIALMEILLLAARALKKKYN